MINHFSKLLKAYREQHNLTQQQLARQLGISRTYLSQIERELANNLSWNTALKILNLSKQHEKIQVTLQETITIDAAIAPEIIWLNSQGVRTEGCCTGPPPTAMIKPSSTERARELGYNPAYDIDLGLFEICLKSESVRASESE